VGKRELARTTEVADPQQTCKATEAKQRRRTGKRWKTSRRCLDEDEKRSLPQAAEELFANCDEHRTWRTTRAPRGMDERAVKIVGPAGVHEPPDDPGEALRKEIGRSAGSGPDVPAPRKTDEKILTSPGRPGGSVRWWGELADKRRILSKTICPIGPTPIICSAPVKNEEPGEVS